MNYFILKKKENIKKIKNIRYSLMFASIISPRLINQLRFLNNTELTNNNDKKVFIKQSYILLTWFYYLSFLNLVKKNKNKIKFFVLPTKREKFTLTKAPMAHKNWSKEQYKFEFFKFKISFTSTFKNENHIKSTDEGLFFILLLKKNFPTLETNVLFLKSIKIFFFITDKKYFNYYIFNKNL